MSDTFVTLHGWVGSDVSFREPHGISVVNLRVGLDSLGSSGRGSGSTARPPGTP